MRMDTTRGESAADFLARADERQLSEVIKDYGEERFARQIAKALVARRESGHPIRTTAELSQLVARSVRTREAGQDPATRTFQALRIHVNAELEALDEGLKACLELLAPGARLAVIAFHSLEDRRVKEFIARESRDVVDRRAPFAPPKAMRLTALARIKPSAEEIAGNPRARSAILRVAEDGRRYDTSQHLARRRAGVFAASTSCARPTTRAACSPNSTARRTTAPSSTSNTSASKPSARPRQQRARRAHGARATGDAHGHAGGDASTCQGSAPRG